MPRGGCKSCVSQEDRLLFHVDCVLQRDVHQNAVFRCSGIICTVFETVSVWNRDCLAWRL